MPTPIHRRNEMRRFMGLSALGAILLSLAAAGVQAQQKTYTQTATFQTSNQSMWSPSLGTAGYSYDINLSRSWEYHGLKRRYKDVWLLGTFGGSITVDTKGSAGL